MELFHQARAAIVFLISVSAFATEGIVVSYHTHATDAGKSMLDAGGNAFDAFVAATLAEYVVAEGGTSLAGTLGAIVYDAKNKAVQYLDADYNKVRDPQGTWDSSSWDLYLDAVGWSRSGKAVLVPGALAGLEEMSRKYGRLAFRKALQPAIKLASEGFPVTEAFSVVVRYRADVLKKSAYGARAFFHNGEPLPIGSVFKQPEVATFLSNLAQHGSAYMYRGEWAKQCVQAVRGKGGRMTEGDLAEYRPVWRTPYNISYRGYEIFGPSGRDYGGIWIALALSALQNTSLQPLGHFSNSANTLETLIRTARQVWEERWWFEDAGRLDDLSFVRSKLAAGNASEIWNRVATKLPAEARVTGRKAHSYHIIVADAEGNVVSGTNSIQSLSWGNGVFVQGIPLNVTGYLPSKSGPGTRVVNALTMNLAFKDGKFQFATGAITGSLLETNLQLLVNLVDYQMPPREAVTLPRFGTFPYDLNGNTDVTSNWLDPAIKGEVTSQIEAHGLALRRTGPLICTGLDTGLGGIVAARGNSLAGEVVPWPGLTVPWRSCAGQ